MSRFMINLFKKTYGYSCDDKNYSKFRVMITKCALLIVKHFLCNMLQQSCEINFEKIVY